MRSVLLFFLVIGVFALFLSMRYQSTRPVTSQQTEQAAQQQESVTVAAAESPQEQHAAINVRQITDMPPPEEMWKQEQVQLHQQASAGSVSAQRELGLLYVHSKEGERDYQKGYYWFGRAAEQEDPLSLVYVARYHLGDFSFPGFLPSVEVAYGILEKLDENAYAEILPLRERARKQMRQQKEFD